MSGRKSNKPKQQPGKQRKPTAAQRRQQSARDKARNGSRQSSGPKSEVKSSVAAAYNRNVKTTRPKMTTLPNGDCVITHTEYVAEVVAGTGTPSPFTSTSYPINPGQAGTFLWLSKIAANYESYVFEKLRFRYETEASSSLGGSAILMVDYDAADPAPLNKQAAMAYRGTVRTVPWSATVHNSLREDLAKNKTNFVRPTLQPGGTDIKSYDIGNLFVISQGVATSAAVLGELHVDYTIRLMTPTSVLLPTTIFGGATFGANTQTAANPMGIAPTFNAGFLGVTLNNASVFGLATPGTYIFTADLTGTTITAMSLAATSGVPTVAVFQAFIANAAGTNASLCWSVKVTAVSTLTFTVTAATVTGASMGIAMVPQGTF